VSEQLVPVLEELGLRSPSNQKGTVFRRRRDDFDDEVHIRWDKSGRPCFAMEFRTSQAERMTPPGAATLVHWLYYGRIYPQAHGAIVRTIKLFLTGNEGWFGSTGDIRKTIDVAKERARDLDAYLRTGEPRENIWVGNARMAAVRPRRPGQAL
jgi:hypothetical protein